MRAPNRLVALALLGAIGCATPNPAPPEWSPTNREAGTWVHGHWVIVTTRAGVVSGELIAVGSAGEWIPSYVYVAREDGVVAVARDDIQLITVTEYEPETSYGAAWTTFGVVSTVTHGLVLIFTAPSWLLLGGIPSASDSRQGVEHHQEGFWNGDDVRKFARFPQGLPLRLRKQLEAKPR